MKNSIKTTMAALLVSGIAAGSVWAADTATQNVAFSVDAINEISVSGDPAAMTVTAGIAGAPPVSDSDSSTTYAVSTNDTNRKITAEIDIAMPPNVTLNITLAEPSQASSTGATPLILNPSNVVTGITKLNESDLGITYDLSATSAANPVTSSRTVTLTLTEA